MPAPPFDTLLICASPRSGSTLLCTMLAEAGLAGKPASYFRREDLEEYAGHWRLPRDASGAWSFADYLAAALKAGASPNGITAIRLMAATVPELEAGLARLWPDLSPNDHLIQAFGRIRAVHLSRGDPVAQAVSRLKAEQSGLWHRADTWVEDYGPSAPLGYDRARIAAFVAELQADSDAWEAFFARTGLAPVRLTYEALSADPTAEVLRLLPALGLPEPALKPRARTERLADEVSRDWAARFRAGD